MQHKKVSPQQIRFAVLTISDTRTPATDKSGKLAQELIQAKGFSVTSYLILPDSIAELTRGIDSLLRNTMVDAIVCTGGTGISQRDITPEVVATFLDLSLHGFGELFRALSHAQIGSATILSRAVAGIARGKPIFALPGSSKAVSLGMKKIILPEIGHILAEICKAQ